jgi:hypothetical protein
MKIKPSAGPDSVTQYVNARKERPHGKTPFTEPRIKMDIRLLFSRTFENINPIAGSSVRSAQFVVC